MVVRLRYVVTTTLTATPLLAALLMGCLVNRACASLDIDDDPGIQGFGMGLSQGHIHLEEEVLYQYNVSHNTNRGVLTHFWITGGDYMCGNDTAAGTCPPPLGNTPHESATWNVFIDSVVFRYYIDGETTASIQFSPNLACGVGPFASRVHGPTATPQPMQSQPGAGTTRPTTSAPWSSKYFGQGSANGGWFFNVRVPFSKSIRITHHLPAVPGHPEVSAVRTFVQVRGAENLPITIGGVVLPRRAKLKLQRIEGELFNALAWVPLLDVKNTSANGAVLLNTLAVETESKNFMEGCVHFYSPHGAAFPGTLLATGLEDWYNSAYYFSAGQFTFPEVGQTFFGGQWSTKSPGQWSAYRVHDTDPQFFRGGVRLMWRVGDAQKNVNGVLYKCLAPPGCAPEECPTVGTPTKAKVWSYTWYYEW